MSTPGPQRRPRPELKTGKLPRGAEPAAVPATTVRVLNLANALTGLRLLLVPVFALLLFAQDGHQDNWRIAAWGAFAVAAFTDRLDGQVARAWGQVTEFGKLADPIADKALTGTALVGLSMLGDLSWWVTAVVLVREVGVTLLRFWVLRHGVIPASRGGKLKTFLLSVAIGLYVLPLTGVLHDAAVLIMAVAVLIAVVTGFDYVRQAFRLRRGTPSTDGSAARSGGSAGAAGQSRQGAEPLATDGSDAR
ncbi:MAG: CDP-diacylglycerol---glycerol-3-phosphate 3-phosphatidyltransferase [Frankiaceae bacterium]|nr:CDP-diacylglycerol---glycerol-3-phosphate 3-phosphatidyltransferase [Frankiaceae bacterium]